ncbi:MAG: PaaI family thioesterase [Desulfobacterales bacterium]|nr:PaaI family thioesterase [Desulfobacterales bacterium]
MTQEQIRHYIEKPFAFVERMGLQALVLEPRHVKLCAPLEGNGNHIGSMYAGALFTLAEIPGGALFLTTFDVDRFYPIVKEMTIRFRRLAATDAFIEMFMDESEVRRIEGEADANGKSEYILEGEVKDADGQVVATSRGIYQLRKHGM